MDFSENFVSFMYDENYDYPLILFKDCTRNMFCVQLSVSSLRNKKVSVTITLSEYHCSVGHKIYITSLSDLFYIDNSNIVYISGKSDEDLFKNNLEIEQFLTRKIKKDKYCEMLSCTVLAVLTAVVLMPAL